MSIFLYNTLTRAKEECKPLEQGVVKMYHCGPTAYDHAHIGNLRSFVTADLLRRMFEYEGFTVNQVMNVTDVDDKTIARAALENISLKDLTEKYTKLFLNDLDALNILRPERLLKATDHIEEMVSLIEKLVRRGHAYKGADGSIYFKISSFGEYGALAEIEKMSLKEGARISHDEYDKENAHDFSLWKAWSEKDGPVFWETSLGKGRPGWHIECSAMSMSALGETFDIHTGGIDLIFPHHTNEIAQSEGASGRKFVNYWLHNEHILIDGKKMAKSEGNILTLKDIISQLCTPPCPVGSPKANLCGVAYRYWLLTAHYHTRVNFTWDAVRGAHEALKRLYAHYKDLGEEVGEVHDEYRIRFHEAIEDDLDTPRALALTWELVKDQTIDSDCKKATLLDFDRVLGLNLALKHPDPIPAEILALLSAREEARAREDFERADELRSKINTQGFSVDDTPEGPKINKII